MVAGERAKVQGIVMDIASARAEAAKWRSEAQADAVERIEAAKQLAQRIKDDAVVAADKAGTDARKSAADSLSAAQAANAKALEKAKRELAEIEAATAKAKAEAGLLCLFKLMC